MMMKKDIEGQGRGHTHATQPRHALDLSRDISLSLCRVVTSKSNKTHKQTLVDLDLDTWTLNNLSNKYYVFSTTLRTYIFECLPPHKHVITCTSTTIREHTHTTFSL